MKTAEAPNSPKILLIFGISLGILILILLILILSYFWTCKRLQPHPSDRSAASEDEDDSINLELGVNESILVNCPKLLYSQAKMEIKGKNVISSGCAVCLAEYAEEDVVRLLPDCEHIFHVDCVDPWLKRSVSCPICRKSPVPTEEKEIAAGTRRREFFRSWFTPFNRS